MSCNRIVVAYLLQFEKTDNKPVVIGYVAAAAFAFFTAEWLIHLPALDIVSQNTVLAQHSKQQGSAQKQQGSQQQHLALRVCPAQS